MWRSDGSYELEPVQIVTDAVEESLTAAEERGDKTDLHLVNETDSEILLRGLGSAGERYILAAAL